MIQRTIAKVLFVLALPLVFFGLIDPLEGGLALFAALVVYAIGFILVKQWPPKILWIPFVASFLLGVLVIVLAITTREPEGQGLSLPIMAGLWVYRGLVVVTLVGAVLNAVNYLTNKR